MRHSPRSTVNSLVKEEGHLDEDARQALVESIWSDDDRRAFALDLMGTIADGTHVSVWTDPDATAHQDRIADFLAG